MKRRNTTKVISEFFFRVLVFLVIVDLGLVMLDYIVRIGWKSIYAIFLGSIVIGVGLLLFVLLYEKLSGEKLNTIRKEDKRDKGI